MEAMSLLLEKAEARCLGACLAMCSDARRSIVLVSAVVEEPRVERKTLWLVLMFLACDRGDLVLN